MLEVKDAVIIENSDLEILKSKADQADELMARIDRLQNALLESKRTGGHSADVRLFKTDFLEMYDKELEKMANADEVSEEASLIYYHDVEVHWAGFYCNCGDGAVAYNHIISGIEGVLDEDDSEYGL